VDSSEEQISLAHSLIFLAMISDVVAYLLSFGVPVIRSRPLSVCTLASCAPAHSVAGSISRGGRCHERDAPCRCSDDDWQCKFLTTLRFETKCSMVESKLPLLVGNDPHASMPMISQLSFRGRLNERIAVLGTIANIITASRVLWQMVCSPWQFRQSYSSDGQSFSACPPNMQFGSPLHLTRSFRALRGVGLVHRRRVPAERRPFTCRD